MRRLILAFLLGLPFLSTGCALVVFTPSRAKIIGLPISRVKEFSTQCSPYSYWGWGGHGEPIEGKP